MGRCPVRAVFADALELLGRKQHLFGYVRHPATTLVGEFVSRLTLRRFMFEHVMPLSEAVSGYEQFDKMKVQKVIFTP